MRAVGLIVAAAAVSALPMQREAEASRLVTQYRPGQCRAVDGDTLRCGPDRIRLVEIDAPEKRRCRRGRTCVSGDPVSSEENLHRAVRSRVVEVRHYDVDRYGRVVGDARVGGRSLSCVQIRAGHAQRVLRWADYGVTRRECPR